MSKPKLDFAGRVIDLGERIQALESNHGVSGLLKWIVRVEQASDSAAFVDPLYMTAQRTHFPAGQRWVRCQPDPEAGSLSRSKKKAVILAVGASAVESLTTERLKAQGIHDTKPVVAYEYKGVGHVGLLDDGFSVATAEVSSHADSDEKLLIAAMREDRQGMAVTLGQFGVATRTLWVLDGVRVLYEHIPTISLPSSTFPDIRLA